MPLCFRSLCSSSSGNCLLIWSDTTRIMIDCGLPSMRRARELFENSLGSGGRVDAVIVSHMHGDHINHESLRVIDEYGLDLMVYERCLDQLRGKHYNGHRFRSMGLNTFSLQGFTIGDLQVQPFEVPHNPKVPNCGFVVNYKDGRAWKKAVIATDFHDGRGIGDYFTEADFLFVESNHDPLLLARYFNPNSRFHMSNPKTAGLLHTAIKQSRKKPHTVMLGHLSSRRNTERHALEETERFFRENGTQMGFNLFTAPRYEGSRSIDI